MQQSNHNTEHNADREDNRVIAWCIVICLAIAAMAYTMVMLTCYPQWHNAPIMFQLFMFLPNAFALFAAAWIVIAEIN